MIGSAGPTKIAIHEQQLANDSFEEELADVCGCTFEQWILYSSRDIPDIPCIALYLLIKYEVITNSQCDICTALEYVFEYTGFKKYRLPFVFN
jgi:hypothetical protein